jgi:hypothetical protein
MKIERSLSASVTGQETNGRVVRILFRILRRLALTIQPGFAQSNLEQIRTSAIILPRRILCGNTNKLREQVCHLVFALPQPSEDGARLRRFDFWLLAHFIMLEIRQRYAKLHIGVWG